LKTTNLLLLLALFSSLLWLSGCSDEAKNKLENYNLIASEKNLPENFYEIAFQRKDTAHSPKYEYLVRKADNESDFEDLWKLYNFKKHAPELDFNDKSVFFIGVIESGSCPFKIEKVEPNSDNTNITIGLIGSEGLCTDDISPRTFVIQMDKEKSKDVETVTIVENEAETSVPLD